MEGIKKGVTYVKFKILLEKEPSIAVLHKGTNDPFSNPVENNLNFDHRHKIYALRPKIRVLFEKLSFLFITSRKIEKTHQIFINKYIYVYLSSYGCEYTVLMH